VKVKGGNMNEDCMDLIRTAQQIIETGKELSSAIEMFRLCMISEESLKNRLGKILGGVE